MLITGCSGALNRTEEIGTATKARRRRAVDCSAACAAVTDYGDMCAYDCVAADASGLPETVSMTQLHSSQLLLTCAFELL